MPKKIIELFLTGNPTLREQCLDRIAKKFKVQRPWPYYKDAPPELSRFFRFETKASKNVWDIAAALLKIGGVIEADPVAQTLGIAHRQTGAYDSDEDYSTGEISTLWNHESTSFIQARDRVDKSGPVTVRIGQLDTGYTYHPGLGSRVVHGYDFLDSDGDPYDPLIDGALRQPGHGTSTASVIIGSDFLPNPSSIQKGVWPDAPFQAFRIAKSVVHVFHSYISEAICKAVDVGCSVITMSMGGAPPRRSWLEALRYAYDKGVIVCCAAGNNVGFVVWPARYTNAIAVGAVNVHDKKWEGSCYGEDVDISAPGENVYVAQTTRTGDDSQAFLNTYGSGTSFATPHVAAAAAMWLHHFRKELAGITGRSRVDAFRWALEQSARIPEGWKPNQLGKGILDADKLLQYSPADYKPASVSKGIKRAGAFRLHRSGDKMYEAEAPLTMDIRDKEMMHLLYTSKGRNAAQRLANMKKSASASAKTKLENIEKQAKSQIKKVEAPKGITRGLRGIKRVQPAVTMNAVLDKVLHEQFNALVKSVS